MTNITNRIALSAAIEALSPDYTFDHVTTAKHGTKTTTTYSADDIVEKLTKMIEQLDKKASAPKKPTAKQVSAKADAEEVLELLRMAGKPVTVSELMEMFPTELAKFGSNQKVASLLRSMLDGAVIRTEEKRKAYFQAAQ
jgi:DNA-binding transcriptional regulator GbsR (MarR family)